MKQAAIDAFWPLTKKFEGSLPWMYLDVLGLVTIGAGNLIEADGKPDIPKCLVFELNGQRVDEGVVLTEWEHVKSLQGERHMGGMAYESKTVLRATKESLDLLFANERDWMWGVLLGYFPDAESWPADAQLGVMSLAWACGPHFAATWPKFKAAALAQDWTTCAEESHISEDGNPGIVPRNAATKALFLAAVASDPERVTES